MPRTNVHAGCETNLGGRAGAEAGVAPRPPEAEASPRHLPAAAAAARGSRSPAATATAAGTALVRPCLDLGEELREVLPVEVRVEELGEVPLLEDARHEHHGRVEAGRRDDAIPAADGLLDSGTQGAAQTWKS